ncbi:DUF1330 domain-containing protein [Streptomyces platensis]|uniref:DUF1330 domain-containing protein n=1 Tax=Streptomyces platensis TaxID=58346 RepID=UPI003F5ED637
MGRTERRGRWDGTARPRCERYRTHRPAHQRASGRPQARDWYASPAYLEILPLRTRHVDGDVVLVPGVPDGYDPAVTAAKLRAVAAG